MTDEYYMNIQHYPNCNANYPEKLKSEAPRHIVSEDIEYVGIVYTCVDCGAFVIDETKEIEEQKPERESQSSKHCDSGYMNDVRFGSDGDGD